MGVTIENYLEFFKAHEALVLVGLKADGVNGNPGLEAAVDKYLITCAEIKIVD